MIWNDVISDIKSRMESAVLLPGEENKILSICNNGGRNLQHFKPENRTYLMCLAAVMLDGTALEFVPEKYRTAELYAAACKANGQALGFIPEENITAAMCKDAVGLQGTNLQLVPEKLKTEELCLLALKTEPKAFAYIPQSMLTPEFCAKSLKEKIVNSLDNIPKEIRSASFYEELIELEPKAIYSVPQKYRTASLCRKYLNVKKHRTVADAINDDENIIGMLNSALLDHDACLAAVKTTNFSKAINDTRWLSDPLKLSYGSVSLKKLLSYPDVSLLAVKQQILLMKFVPKEGVNQEVIETVADSDGGLRYIPEQYKTKEICNRAFKKDLWSFCVIPDQFKTAEMCLTAVRESGFLLEHVPDELKTTEMCKIAVKDDGHGTPYVPYELYDKELANLVLKYPGSKVFPLKIIPKQFLDYDMCKYAVTNIWGSLQDVPEEYKDYDLCLCAVMNDPRAAQYVPSEFFARDEMILVAPLQYIPEEKRTEEACLKHAKQGATIEGNKFKYIPDRLLTKDLCEAAVLKSAGTIIAVPDEFITEEMLLKVAEVAPAYLSVKFPERLKTEELCIKLIKINPVAEKYI